MLIQFSDANGNRYVLDISHSELFFGSNLVGSDAASQTLALKNVGWADISLREIALSGSTFSIEGENPGVLRPNQKVEFEIGFSPTTGGPSTGSIYIDAGVAGTAYVRLYGAGFSTVDGDVDITGMRIIELASDLETEELLNFENGTKVWVYNDPDLGLNGFYTKNGASGVGSFDGPFDAYAESMSNARIDIDMIEDVATGAANLNGTGLVSDRLGGSHKTIAKLESEFQAKIDAQTLEEETASDSAAVAVDARDAAEAWAEGTLPGGAGTKSAKGWAGDSAISAATAESASGPTYASTAAGLAATTSGQAFAVDAGGGLVSVYLNSSGTAVLQRTLATTGALAASGGAALVGSDDGASGTLWTTVAGFIARLMSSAGSSVISFIQSGTGAVSRSLQTRGREVIHATDYSTLAEAVAAAPAGAVIFCPPGYTHTVASTITINKDVTIRGGNWRGVQITGPANAPIFEGASGVTNFILEGITWIGGAGTSQLLKVTTANAWLEGKTIIRGCKINNFGAFAVERGDSSYFTEIRGNRFDNCVGCISEGWASDSVIDDNLFNDSMAGNPIIRLVGGSRTVITSNGFVRATGTITEADIEFNPATSFGRGGRAFVLHNKFGGEGETSARPKIRTYNATADNRSTDIVVAFNQLHGAANSVGGTTHCFQFDTAIAGWDVFGNEFDEFNLIVQDNAGKFSGVLGSNKWGRNRYFWSTRTTGKLFTNGGRMFSEVEENVFGYQPPRIMYEPREARNRLWNSTALTSWNKSSGVTITGGQADPDGGTNAFLIESDGSAAAQNVFRSIDITGMGNTVIVKLRLKAGASSKIIVGLRDSAATSGWVGMLQNLVLDSQWRDYVFTLTVVNPANAHQLYIYPGDTVATRAGGFYIYQPQVSDYDSDFLPTASGAGASDTTIGRRFGKKVSLAGGAKATLPTYADNAAALAGGLTATDLYKTATGELRIVV